MQTLPFLDEEAILASLDAGAYLRLPAGGSMERWTIYNAADEPAGYTWPGVFASLLGREAIEAALPPDSSEVRWVATQKQESKR